MSEHNEEEVQAAYLVGMQDGYDQGREEALAEGGFDEGYEKGHQAGYDKGYASAPRQLDMFDPRVGEKS